MQMRMPYRPGTPRGYPRYAHLLFIPVFLLLIRLNTYAQPGSPQFDFEKKVNFLLPAVGASDQIIVHDGYTLRFEDTYKVAAWVAYPLLPQEITGDTQREGSRFKPDPAVLTGSALPADYTKSGYDRGHLAPAGDFRFSRQMMSESFYMSNMTPSYRRLTGASGKSWRPWCGTGACATEGCT